MAFNCELFLNTVLFLINVSSFLICCKVGKKKGKTDSPVVKASKNVVVDKKPASEKSTTNKKAPEAAVAALKVGALELSKTQIPLAAAESPSAVVPVSNKKKSVKETDKLNALAPTQLKGALPIEKKDEKPISDQDNLAKTPTTVSAAKPDPKEEKDDKGTKPSKVAMDSAFNRETDPTQESLKVERTQKNSCRRCE
uniref:Uncharacterized protein n=1 Tax=Rhabditophanes sp. KR3021 TaxID=114890 RepID=A0AC35TSC0_9BILA